MTARHTEVSEQLLEARRQLVAEYLDASRREDPFEAFVTVSHTSTRDADAASLRQVQARIRRALASLATRE
jgi:hypothetical protein